MTFDRLTARTTTTLSTMRIHLPLEPKHFTSNPTGPLAKIGGDLVLIELQGKIEVEGNTANSVIGVLGLDRPVSGLPRPSVPPGRVDL